MWQAWTSTDLTFSFLVFTHYTFCATKISRGTHHVIRRKASCYEFRKPHICLVVRIFYPSTSHETARSLFPDSDIRHIIIH
ncbi:TPA: hypothetical protein ACQ7VX_005151, partial [Escherichia coli]